MIPEHFIINQGKFEGSDDRLIFCGQQVTQNVPFTNDVKTAPLYGEILFPMRFRAGSLSFDIMFEDVEQDTRAGIILNYRNKNGKVSFYQVGIRQRVSEYSLDYYDGEKWNFLLLGGAPSTIEKGREYSIRIELKGNILSLFINSVLVFEYDNFINDFNGVSGIYVCNSFVSTIQNICIEQKKPSVFCIMKFEKDFNALYADVIKVQCGKLNLAVYRADEHYTSGSILQDIIQDIYNASIIIADITIDNPNVFYELGFAHALKKPTILLADIEKRGNLPFDISGYRTIFYSNTIGGKAEIEETLIKYIRNIIE